MIDHQALRPGTRVRLHSHPIGLILTSFTGQVIGPDPLWDDYYIIRLDTPAYQKPRTLDVPAESLLEIREAADNLDVVGSE